VLLNIAASTLGIFNVKRISIMGLPTQIAARNRQTASLYPYPLTPLLGGLNLVSTSITAVILGDFILELLDGKMSVPAELAVVSLASSTGI